MQSKLSAVSLEGTIGFTIAGGGMQTGWGIADAGDMNNDGRDDLIVSTDSTQAYVVYGGGTYGTVFDLSLLDGTTGLIFGTGSTAPVRQHVTSVDINGDGISDVVLGSSIVFGSSNLPGQINGTELDGTNGFRIANGDDSAGLTDFNGDGFGDLAVGQRYESVTIYFGSDQPFSPIATSGLTITGPAKIGLASSVESAGDFNADGLSDLLIGAPHTDGHGFATGSAYVVFGSAGQTGTLDVSELDGSNGFRIDGAEGASRLGYSAGSAGDVNGDGFDDILVQATDADPTQEREGSTYVVFGRAGGMPAVLDLEDLGSGGMRIDGLALRGQAMSAATGDFNGDGFADIAIGSPDRSPLGVEIGDENAYVIFGRADLPDTINVGMLDGSNGFQFAGGIGQSDLGRFVEFSDLNGDGFDELVVSAPRANGLTGEVYVVYGHDTGPLTPFVDPVPHIVGTADADILRGTEAHEVQEGLAGDDQFKGGKGTGGDQYRGGSGFDTISYASADRKIVASLRPSVVANSGTAANDTYLSIESVVGTAYNDTITGDHAANKLYGGEGGDVLRGLQGDDRLSGSDGKDTLNGGAGFDTIYGGGGADKLNGGNGADSMHGDDGDDLYIVNEAGDIVREDVSTLGGVDTVQSAITYLLSENLENLTLIRSADIEGTGNANDNMIRGNTGNNVLTGLDGNDTLDGGAGADTLVGGFGDDTYVVKDAGDVVSENAEEGTDTAQTTLASYTLGANVENLVYAGSGDFAGTGNTLGNRLTGGAGNDTLDGGDGADTLVGGFGDDTYVVKDAGDVVSENPEEGTDTVQTTLASYTLSANVENLVFAGLGDFAGTGNTLGNSLTGGEGNDTLDGGEGGDTMVGGSGDDLYIVYNSGDVVTEGPDEGTDTAETILASYTLSANVENLMFAGLGDFAGAGNALDNGITGGAGNDTLDGGAGADTLVGGSGDDTYVVDDPGDVVGENPEEGIDTVQSAISYTLSAALENLALTGMADSDGTGTDFDNSIFGNGGANLLAGKGGNDTLTGGPGNDTFQFDTPLVAGNTATITDLTVGADRISLALWVFTQAGALGALASEAFHTGSAAHDVDDRIIYDAANGSLIYDADGTGSQAGSVFAKAFSGLALSAGDFEIV